MSELPAELLQRFERRERRALAEIISRVEQGDATPPPPRGNPKARMVGITGSAGTGKSTLVAASIAHLRRQGRTVGVLACDPQSPVTGGALLGDRVRVRFDAADDGVYFRSLSTRGAMGGISAAVGPALDWLAAFDFDLLLVETVGIGQDQVAVRYVVDTLVLLLSPNAGDEIQWEKAGLLELADLVVINKADLPGADRMRQELQWALSLDASAKVPVLAVSAASGQGVAELWEKVLGNGEQGTGKGTGDREDAETSSFNPRPSGPGAGDAETKDPRPNAQ